jgi:hypothetical protein
VAAADPLGGRVDRMTRLCNGRRLSAGPWLAESCRRQAPRQHAYEIGATAETRRRPVKIVGPAREVTAIGAAGDSAPAPRNGAPPRTERGPFKANPVGSSPRKPRDRFDSRAPSPPASGIATTRWGLVSAPSVPLASIWRSGRCDPFVRTRPSGRGRIVGFNRRPEEDVMESVVLLNRAGRRRSQATLSGFHQGRVPRKKGLRCPPDPPPVEEILP